MNGRAYDYNLGRFYGVDPFIQFPSNSQSLNPYSYLMNNPLAGTDPTGYLSNCIGSLCEKYREVSWICEQTCVASGAGGGNGAKKETADSKARFGALTLLDPSKFESPAQRAAITEAQNRSYLLGDSPLDNELVAWPLVATGLMRYESGSEIFDATPQGRYQSDLQSIADVYLNLGGTAPFSMTGTGLMEGLKQVHGVNPVVGFINGAAIA
jgi:hypothetical protein